MRRLRVGMAQVNTTVGDFKGNTQKIIEAIAEAKSLEVDLLTFPELATCGYPPEDLLFKRRFIEENLQSLEKIVEHSLGLTVIVGFVDAKGGDLYDAAATISDGKLAGIYHKIHLPNYGVFDENRYFQAGKECPVYIIDGVGIGVNICEDIWYKTGPAMIQASAGAEIIVNISASPYHAGKSNFREKMLGSCASDNIAIVVYNNLVGGQDELVFDGNSMVLNEKGQLVTRGKQFEEDMVVTDLDIQAISQTRFQDSRWKEEASMTREKQEPGIKILTTNIPFVDSRPPQLPVQDETHVMPDEVYDALVLGTHDYVTKNGFKEVVIGLSGGIDSGLVATIAVDALGAANVVGVSMPSGYSSAGSISDAELLAHNLGIKLITVPIEPAFHAYLEMLAESFGDSEFDITEENIQARIRGNILMALSNKLGWLVLTTGNKSEMATGYATLYGDMAGGFAVIKDVPKTLVYELARYRNSIAKSGLIPSTMIDKAPSAELRPEQKDADSLPEYDLLDPILVAYVEEDKSIEQIVSMGFAEEMVRRVARLVDTSEYKRRQSPPGIKITPKAFGKDRRLPITNRFRGR